MKYDTFIAANSSKGFFSFFDDITKDENMERIYLIKGGPGCGKSTFMKKIAQQADKKGYLIEQIHCSSDSDSLDGIVLNDKKIVIIDATSPHAYDMQYPGAIDSIIDLSKFWDENTLVKNKHQIIEITKSISEKYKKVYCVLKSVGLLYEQIGYITEKSLNNEKVLSFISKTVKKNAFAPIKGTAKISRRFLSAINCEGISTLKQTISNLCENGIIIQNDTMIAEKIILKFYMYFKKCGYDINLYFNPLCPESKIDHIIIPQLKFGVFTTSKLFPLDLSNNDNIKYVNSKTFTDMDIYNNKKNAVSFRIKIISELINSAIYDMKEIKHMHDELEKYYINSMNYDELNSFTQQFINKI